MRRVASRLYDLKGLPMSNRTNNPADFSSETMPWRVLRRASQVSQVLRAALEVWQTWG